VLALVLLALAGCVQEEEEKTLEEMLKEIAEKDEQYRNFVQEKGFEEKISVLEKEEVMELKESGGIYAELPEKNIYRVEYSNGEYGTYHVLIDLEEEKVLTFYRMSGIQIGG